MDVTRTDLIGRHLKITGSPNKEVVGMEGEVLFETLNTLVLLVNGKEKQIQKKGNIFEIDGKTVTGEVLSKRPKERIKQKKKKW